MKLFYCFCIDRIFNALQDALGNSDVKVREEREHMVPFTLDVS